MAAVPLQAGTADPTHCQNKDLANKNPAQCTVRGEAYMARVAIHHPFTGWLLNKLVRLVVAWLR